VRRGWRLALAVVVDLIVVLLEEVQRALLREES
jgi:hypothetical protein